MAESAFGVEHGEFSKASLAGGLTRIGSGIGMSTLKLSNKLPGALGEKTGTAGLKMALNPLKTGAGAAGAGAAGTGAAGFGMSRHKNR